MREVELSESTGCCSLLEEGAFREAITRERKRSDRSGRALVLLLVDRRDSVPWNLRAGVSLVTDVLWAMKGDIGTLGWFEEGHTIGLIVPEIESQDVAGVCAGLETEFDKAVAHHAGLEALADLSLMLRVYPEQDQSDDALAELMDPFLYPELFVDRKVGLSFHIFKRGMDLVFSFFLLLLLSPLFLILAAIVQFTSRGPVFFRQVRVGHMMKPFAMYKFRTMYVGMDHQVHHDYVSWFINSSSQAKSQNGNAVFKLTKDPRITPIGRLLRRTSLDELPQLWNVLIGDMSLVGPRPPLPYELRQYKPWHRGRVLEAKPGMTGLWQVVGRSRTTFDEMVRLDLQYARSMSLWFDVKILCATPGAMISGKGAR
jgi:lipopolysaccharide/colanic/teichoic acid biosynthesis glycosyltransferase